jgi:hypothetical protein
MSHLIRTGVLLGSLFVVAACSATTQGVRPNDMSAREHHQHAAAERREAAQHRARYDPTASRRSGGNHIAGFDSSEYNPTTRHIAMADEHREHAREHEQAARALEGFTKAECAEFSSEVRRECPLLTVVDAVLDVPGGARLAIHPGTNIGAVVAHMKCHHAFGREQHFESMKQCPLYLDDVEIAPGPDGQSVTLTSKDPATVRQIRLRARSHAL